MDVFLLCGQSNMAGRGGVVDRAWDGAVPAACALPPGARVACLQPDGGAWGGACEPLHAGVDAPGKPCGVGPGLAFAAALAAQRGLPVGLVPCAVGGSALREWELPCGGQLGQRAVSRARAALAAPCEHGAPRLAGVLWYQGETDAGSAADAATWGPRFSSFAAALRAELCAPSLPFVVVAITAASAACPHLDAVRAAQLAAPDTVPHAAVVDAAGLALQADGLHLTADAAAALGSQLAAAWLGLAAAAAPS